MKKLKETIKKSLEKTYWVETSKKFEQSSQYPQEYEQKFGNISLNTILLDEYMINANKIDVLHEFLRDNGFDTTQQYKINDYGMGYYYREDLMVMLRCSFGNPDKKIKDNTEDESDDAIDPHDSASIAVYFCPLLENKESIHSFLYGLIDLDILFKPDSKKNFYMIAQNAQGLYKQRTTFNNIEIKDGRYDLYYGKKCPIDKFKQFMRDDKTESLLLLHGDQGAGKSNMLKNLILEADKDVIYIPPSMVSVISSPNFISFMIKNQKNFLIIEDAEEILSVDRNSGTNNLLSICDGFLKDALQMKIICTFNCDLDKIDPALLRKGRLFFEYKFGVLSIKEAQDLSDFCNLGLKVDREMTLAEIFNHNKKVNVENSFEEKRIGFI